jgi:hypothetical protein
MIKSEENVRWAKAPAPAEVRRDEDWLWMIDEDPAFYLEEREVTRELSTRPVALSTPRND